MFKIHNENFNNKVKLLPVKPWYQFIFSDGSKFDYGDTIEKTLNEINKISPQDVINYKKLLNESEKIFNIGFIELASKPFQSILDMIKQIPSLLRLKSYLSVYQLVSRYLQNPKLRQAFSIHPLLVGGNPFTTTSIYSLIHFLEHKWGIFYAQGGTGKIIDAMEELIREKGGRIIVNTEVKRMIIKNKKIIGVETNDKNIIKPDFLVCNADPAYVYKNLLNLPKQNNDGKRLHKTKYSMGLFVLYFSTSKMYDEVEHHTIIFNKRYKELLNDIFEKKIYITDPSLYLHRPAATDPNMRQNNCETFYVLAPVANNLSKINWNKKGDEFSNIIFDILEEKILPGLKLSIKNKFYITPNYFEEDLNTFAGSGFSLEPIFTQSAYFRFNNKSKLLSNLYFVGSGTHPGAGIPGVLSSAEVTTKLIKHHEK